VSDIPRRLIAELLTRYQLEPSIRDVFVEGDFDCDVFERCLEGGTADESVTFGVYPIRTIEVPVESLSALGLTEGNKQRLLALAHDLELAGGSDSYRCVVDRDLDHWFSELSERPGLRWTAHCDLELYFFTDEILRDILKTAAQCKILDWSQLKSSLQEVLISLFSLRLAARELALSVTWISFDRCLKVNASSVQFDMDDYGKRLLNANNAMSHWGSWGHSVEKWREKIGGEPRLCIRGHDLVDLLAWTIRTLKGAKQFADSKAIERLFVLLSDRIRPDLLLLVE
jgi:hypothetical protein